MRLCSSFDVIHCVTCDLPLGHRGPHKATLVWGDDDYDDSEEEEIDLFH